LQLIARKAFLVAGVAVAAAMGARAQPVDPLGDLIDQVVKEAPLDAPVAAHAISHPLTGQDAGLFREAVEAARRGNVNGARNAIASMGDPLARKAATWVLVDSCAESVGFFEVDNARRELAGWPRAAKRQAAAEKLLETAGKSP
jgi:soluble lytic murein transglycosylase